MVPAMSVEHEDADVFEERLWKKSGWIARVIKNEDDHGWAVEMTRAGDTEPALVGPWTMGRDKKNPKPLDAGAFNTLVKTATEVLARHEHAARAALTRTWLYRRPEGDRVRVELVLVPDEDDPRAVVTCTDDVTGEILREGTVSPRFKLDAAGVEHFLRS